jgi:hypothetical protein
VLERMKAVVVEITAENLELRKVLEASRDMPVYRRRVKADLNLRGANPVPPEPESLFRLKQNRR